MDFLLNRSLPCIACLAALAFSACAPTSLPPAEGFHRAAVVSLKQVTSIDGLSPANPSFKIINSQPIEVPHHSIIGDRGKGDTPNSSDGVVEYWSSRLDSAKSEKIVPGPHGACELPETLDELRRILHLHLKSN
jgi:hypothetical protein